MWSFSYRALTDLAAPVIHFYLKQRLAAGREDSKRFNERLGRASLPRPQGKLVWCHAASAGEAASLLSLIEKLRDIYPATSVLITTGTVNSAKMLESRLPPQVIHQYVPVDRMPYVKRFLDHWQPDFALWVESELWPNMLAGLRQRHIPAALVNARMSEKSFHNWNRMKGFAQEILGSFSLCLAQTENDSARFAALGAKQVRCFGNLKYAANPLPCDEKQLHQLQQEIEGRPLWLMASTHRGEENIALAAHRQLREKWPSLLTIIAPRHTVRGDEVAKLIEESTLRFARRSKQEPLTPQTEIYIADTMGELGLFYRLSRIVCVGGSFVPVGGHNPIEPAQLGCTVILGSYTHNCSKIVQEFIQHKAVISLKHPNELGFTLDRLLASPEEASRYAQAAQLLANQKRHVLDQILEALKPWLGAKT